MGRYQRTQDIRVTCAASAQRLRRWSEVVLVPVGIRYWPGPVLVLVLCLRLWPGTGPRLDRYIELLCVAAERTCGQSIWSFSQKM